MKSEMEHRFLSLGRKARPMFWDEEIELVPREYYGPDRRVGYTRNFVFDVVRREGGHTAGEIALRIGDSDRQFYLGHVGYHIDPPFRGRSYALRACRLCLPVFSALGQRSIVITTDPDNLPSIRTCERLGCEYESTVIVPLKVHQALQISNAKRRYLLELHEE